MMVDPVMFPDAPITSVVNRKVSVIEYGHAAAGTGSKSLEVPRVCTLMLAGQFAPDVQLEQWKRAIAEATRVNPGARLQLSRRRGSLVWNSTGAPPALRVVDDVDWDGTGPEGADFLTEQPLDIHGGPVVEVLLVGGKRHFVIFRTPHAVMDGLGLIHFIGDVFRCLRGEAPLGTNSPISDWEMIRGIHPEGPFLPKGRPPYAMGKPAGTTTGDTWRSFRVGAAPGRLLPLVMRTIAESAAEHDSRPARLALPVTLRRFYPGLRTTMNTTGIVHVNVHPADDLDTIAGAIKAKVEPQAMPKPPTLLPVFKLLPPPWVETPFARTLKNFTTRDIGQTATTSNLGRHHSTDFTGGGFTPTAFYGPPLLGNTFLSFCSLDDELWMTVGTENIYATHGRFDAFVDRLRGALGGSPAFAGPRGPESARSYPTTDRG